jgi:hypothetical protein
MMRRWTILVIFVACGKLDRAPATKKAIQPPAASAGSNDTRIVFGASSLALPDGWKEIKREPDRVTFRSVDETEQATISKLELAAEPSFGDFKALSEDRVAAERDVGKDVSLDVTGPLNDGKRFTFMYSGNEKERQRLFSGYMLVAGKTVMTVYVESIGVSAQRNLGSFKAFVTGFRP